MTPIRAAAASPAVSGPVVTCPVAALLALAAGAAWAASEPPRGWWALVPVGAAALTLALAGRRWRARLALAALTGVAHYLWALVWLADFSVPGYLLVAVLQTGLLAAALALAPRARTSPAAGAWTLGPALVLLEAWQARFPFGGFPLTALALGQLDGPFALAAPLGGSLLVTGLAVTSGVALAMLWLERRRPAVLAVPAAVVVLVAAALALGVATASSSPPAGTLDVAVVQGGGPRGIPAVRSNPQATLDRQLAVATQITGRPDLVLLPENVITVSGSVAGSAPDTRIAELATDLRTQVVAGVVETTGTRFRNAALLWDADGQRVDRYDKQHRVPFGEYLPARRLLERASDLTALVPRDAVPGQGEGSLTAGTGPPLGVVISYEVLFADRVRDAVQAGGQILLVPTNAASYVTEQVPAIEIAAARLRAREFGRTILQAAPTGYSAIISPAGEVLAQSPLELPALLRGRAPLHTDLTPYARTGDLPVMALAGLLLAIALIRSRQGPPSQRSLFRQRRT